MRIGLFTDTYSPQVNGVATSTRMLRERLTAAGHEVFVFTTTDPGAVPAVPSGEGLFRIVSIPVLGARRLACPPPTQAARIGRLNLDVIHTQTEFTMGFLGQAAGRRHGIPLVHTMHTFYEDYTHYVTRSKRMEPLARRAVQELTRVFANRADNVIAPTAKAEATMRGYGVTGPIHVIPTGVELGRFAPSRAHPLRLAALRRRHGIGQTDKVIVNVGRLSKEKNVEEILETMRVYLPSRRGVTLLLVGDGPRRRGLADAVDAYGLAGRVVFAGELPWDQIAEYYWAADVFLGASRSETQGLAYIEALASGLPVIAKADPCLDGVLAHGQNGYMFNDTRQMMGTLDAALFDPDNRHRLSATARTSASRFSAEVFAESVEAVYREMACVGPRFPAGAADR
ncbi:MAG: glycosyltransferase family 4 protein [Bifidobacteriaceae bacterium]|jgi:1,2-diacylglycerol 3-alpha-glucosyltransferase|nr:glycosyltransferase family 4 protein [Bifidobacteriaceae bacterium]